MTFEIDRGTGLLISRRQTQITGELLGIVKVGEPAGSHDERGSEGNTDALDGSEQIHLLLVLALGQYGKILFEVFNLLFKEGDGLLNGLPTLGIKERQHFHGTLEVLCGNELLLELADNRAFLLQGKDGITAQLVWRRIHLLPIEGNQAGVCLIRLDGGEHDTGEVLHLERILQTGGDACLGKQMHCSCPWPP